MAEQAKRYCTYVGMFPEGFIDDDGTDLSGVVFYAGSATMRGNSTNRFSTHESAARGGGEGKKCETIRLIWAKGMKVTWKIIDVVDHPGYARALEQKLIKRVSNAYLTNILHNVYPPTEEEVWEAARKGRRQWEQRRRESEERRAFNLWYELSKREQTS